MKYSILSILFFFLNDSTHGVRLTSNHLPYTKLCKDCKYFIADDKTCAQFGSIDLIDGARSYENARDIRLDNEKCGKDAVFFKKNKYKYVTVPYYFVKGNLFVLTVISLYLCLSYLLFFIGKT